MYKVISILIVLFSLEAYSGGPAFLLHKKNPRSKIRAFSYVYFTENDVEKIRVTKCDEKTKQVVVKKDYKVKSNKNVCKKWSLTASLKHSVAKLPAGVDYYAICLESNDPNVVSFGEFYGAPVAGIKGDGEEQFIFVSIGKDPEKKAFHYYDETGVEFQLPAGPSQFKGEKSNSFINFCKEAFKLRKEAADLEVLKPKQ